MITTVFLTLWLGGHWGCVWGGRAWTMVCKQAGSLALVPLPPFHLYSPKKILPVLQAMTEHSFKTRFNNHKVSFKHSHDTVLSKYIWDLKYSNTDFSIKWSIATRARSYRGNPSHCYLCPMEKLCILSADKSALLNKRSELITKCRDVNKFFAANQKRDRFTHPPWVSLNFIPTAIYGTVWWLLREWNSSNCVRVSILN